MIEAVVFDCDGTLLDSMPAWHAMQERLAQRAGVVLGEHELDVLNANTLPETAEFFHRECGLGASSQEVLEYARNMLMGEYLTSVLPREGAVSLVKRLHQDDAKLAVASSSPETFLRAGLTRAGIYDLFDVVASAEDEHQSKSTPRFFWSVAGRLGAMPQRIWGIDDSVYALKAMKEAGFLTAGIYDSDNAGTRVGLLFASDWYLDGFADLDYERFLSGDVGPDSQVLAPYHL